MTEEQEHIEEEVIEDEQSEYDKVYFAEENEAPKEEVENEEPLNDTAQEGDQEEEALSDELPEGEAEAETPEEVEEGEEQPKEDSAPTKTIRWNGKDVEVTEDELVAMAQQGFDYTYKSQNLAQDKREHQTELDLLAKVKDGDKEALAQLSRQSGIDPLDLLDIDVDNIEQGDNKPVAPFMSPEVEQLMQEVEKDSELYERMGNIEMSLPKAVRNVMSQDAGTFYSIVDEVRNGSAEIVLPQVTAKLASLPELDRALVLNNPNHYANFYLSVKQSMVQPQTKQTQPQERSAKPNLAEVGVKRSNTKPRGRVANTDSMSSDKEYQAILDRLQNQ